MTPIFDVGDRPQLTFTLIDDATSANVDADALTLTTWAPDGTTNTLTYGVDPEIVRTGVGVYTYQLELTQPGQWTAKWAATGTYEASQTDTLQVASDPATPPTTPAPVGGAYTSVIQVQALNAARPLTATSIPSADQTRGFILQTAAELNSIISGLGLVVPVQPSATTSYQLLAYYNALGAHCLVEESAPTSRASEKARDMWEAAKQMLKAGDIDLPDAPLLAGNLPRANTPRDPYFTATMAGYGITLQW